MLAGAWLEADHGLGGVEAVEAGLAGDGVGVGGEGRVLDHDLESLAGGAVERDEEQVQIDRERVHRDDLAGQGPDEASGRFAELLVVGVPGVASGEVGVNREGAPVVELLLDGGGGRLRHQAEGVAGEVDARLLAARFVGAHASRAQAIRDIAADREIGKHRVILEHHAGIALVRRPGVDAFTAEQNATCVQLAKARHHA